MSFSVVSKVGRALRGTWWFIDATRRTLLNLLLLALVLGALVAWVRSGGPALQDKTTLVLKLQGDVVEQFSGGVRDIVLAQAQGSDQSQVQLRDLLAVLDAAAADPQIGRVLLQLDALGAVGLPQLREIAAGLQKLRAAGKPVTAWGSSYDQRSHYLAAQADEVWLDPMGMVVFQGYGRLRNYYKSALDKVGIRAEVVRAGQFKSFAEVYTADGPSAQAVEADKLLYDALWADFSAGIEAARKLPAGAVAGYVEQMPALLAAAGGDTARMALQAKLVDALKTADELRQSLTDRGAADTKTKTFRQMAWTAYAARLKARTDGDAVGIIVAEGTIVDGQAGPGTVGGDSTAALVKRARDDERIKAVVLRVNSPGGSAFASERVRRELALTRAAGKPVVVSMGNLAASGGYWVSMAADEVIADAATITGSIGVVALLPTAKPALDKLGITAEGYTTTWLGRGYDPRLDIDPRILQMLQAGIDHAYVDFTSKAATARKTTREKIDAVAQGRVWTGTQALDHGLVDRTGSLADAVAAAASRARLPAGARTQYIEQEPGALQQVMARLQAEMALAFGLQADRHLRLQAAWGLPLAAGALAAVPGLPQDLAWLAGTAQRRQPLAAVVHCLCEAPH